MRVRLARKHPMAHPPSNRRALVSLVPLLVAAGCAAWPFHAKERTSIITPGMRVAAVQEMAARANEVDSAEQARLSEQLATQIRTEPDPLVRKAIQETIAEYSVPLAHDVLTAGLSDEDLEVRLACCRKLGKRSELSSVGALRRVVESDEELDVRLAALDALGKIPSTESVAALGIALKDRDPAMQYAGVQALKAISGLDLGNNVEAWQEYAASDQPQISPQVSIAERMRRYSPF